MNKNTYAQDGVDIEQGDIFSSVAGKMCCGTFNNSPFVEVKQLTQGNFRGPRVFRLKNLPEGYYLDGAPDGIGTKVVVIDAAFSQRQATRDVVAMTASDITRFGGKPLIFFNVLDVSTLGKAGDQTNKLFLEMINGLGEVAKEQEFVCFRGETAELGSCVGSDNNEAKTKFNIAGFMLGAFLEDRLITGKTLAPKQVIVALQEHGFRSNGISSVRKALFMKYGEKWWTNPEAASAIRAAATPSVLYDKFLTYANGWKGSTVTEPMFKFHLISHVSGGGIVDKLFNDNLKPLGLSAVLDDLWQPPQIMKDVCKWRKIPIKESYQTFNSGNGMLVVLDQEEVSAFISLAREFGIKARKCGVTTKSRNGPNLIIQEKYANKGMVTYE